MARSSDERLLFEIARGHPGALAEVYERHGAAVYASARRLCAAAEAESVTQGTFLELWHAPEDFAGALEPLASRLIAEAHARSVDLLRADRTRQGFEAAMSFDVLVALVVASRVGGAVAALLADLPEGERIAVTLTYFGGYTDRQVGVLTGRSVDEVRRALVRGLGQLGATVERRRRG